MKYAEPRPFADPEKAARKLLEIANATEAVQDGRIYIEKINGQFLFKEGGTPAEYSAALAYTVAKGWLWKHESGTYVKFTPAGADFFAESHPKKPPPEAALLFGGVHRRLSLAN